MTNFIAGREVVPIGVIDLRLREVLSKFSKSKFFATNFFLLLRTNEPIISQQQERDKREGRGY